MPKIFVCYRKADTHAVAEQLCAKLQELGSMTVSRTQAVPLGFDFREFIAKEVARNDIVLVLIGPRWLEFMRANAHKGQDFVREEIEVALRLGKLTVPILIGEETSLPLESELPAKIANLVYLNGIHLDPGEPFNHDVEHLIEGLQHASSLRRASAPTAAEAHEEAPEPSPADPVLAPARRMRLEFPGMDLIWVQPGSFWMGSPDDEPGRWKDEGPRHHVTLTRGFWIGRGPVTQAQYQKVIEANPSHFFAAGPTAPVEMVHWNDANSFCSQLAAHEPPPSGLEYRLPTEAEWEYACRAGTKTALFSGPLEIRGAYRSPQLGQIAWYGGNSGVDYEGGADSTDWLEKQIAHQTAGTHPIARKAPNPWGLHDMLGNVWEWCLDGKRSFQETPITDPRGESRESRRVIKGGSWEDPPGDCRCATRFTAGETHRFSYLGFRLVIAPTSSS